MFSQWPKAYFSIFYEKVYHNFRNHDKPPKVKFPSVLRYMTVGQMRSFARFGTIYTI